MANVDAASELEFVDSSVKDIVEELNKAVTKFPGFNSAHEGYGVLLEEVDELWDEVKAQYSDERDANMYVEAKQVAAMALRFMLFMRLQFKKKAQAKKAEKAIEHTERKTLESTKNSEEKIWLKDLVDCKKCNEKVRPNHIHCPKSDSAPDKHELRNYSMMWHDGDVHCTLCNEYVRMWDAG